MPADPYRVVVDQVDPEEWHRLIEGFDDVCIHQSWPFGAGVWGEDRVSHLRLLEGDEVVAAAQVVTAVAPVIGAGIAHCKFGPMWRRRGEAPRPEVYRRMLSAMRDEYAGHRGLLLRIKPWETSPAPDTDACRREAGLQRQTRLPTYDTFVLDLDRSLEELRAGLKSKWRYNLKKAEGRDVEIEASSEPAAAGLYLELYERMRDIKTYVDTSEVDVLPKLMNELPESLRPTVFVAKQGGEPVAAIVVSQPGQVGYYLFGATAPRGRESGASYLLFWEALRWLRSRDCLAFDLVGSRPRGTGGDVGYRRFKEGLTGRNGAEYHMTDWELCDRPLSRVVVGGATAARWYSRQGRHWINGLRERAKRHLETATS
jgi:peptidoglycan pentaglycine glycine transferase (the first glycine)